MFIHTYKSSHLILLADTLHRHNARHIELNVLRPNQVLGCYYAFASYFLVPLLLIALLKSWYVVHDSSAP